MKIPSLKLSLVSAMIALCSLPAAANATVLDFDNLPSTGSYGVIGSYGGLNWSSNFYYINRAYLPNTGYDYGTVSGDYSAFNAGALDVSVSDGSFNFNSAYLTSAWVNQTLNIEGWLAGSLVYSTNVAISNTSATLYNFGWTVDTLKFHSNSNSQFVMDDFTFNASVPDSGASVALLGLGLLCLGATRRLVRR